jgi:ubiquinone/menaquinone biosynthesis C-methylase UbiE
LKTRIEQESSFWNSFAKRYDRFIRHTLGNTYQILFEKLRIDTFESDRILEIATGTGLLSFEICRQVRHIDAIDISPEMIRIAKQKQKEKEILNVSFEVGDSSDIHFSDNSFDIVLASNVLHLLFNPEEALSEIHRVLKPDGRAILPTFCHGENIKSRLISGFMSLFGFKARNKWSVKSFETFVLNNGFKPINVKS